MNGENVSDAQTIKPASPDLLIAPPAGVSVQIPVVPSAPPGYEILEELGRGGMGIVYKARQLGLNRIVALKMILSGTYSSEADLARFRAEAEAIARVRHPNIVQVYDVGEHNGLPFFSIEFCAGGSLDRRLQGNPMAPREAAELVAKLARAVHEAHKKGILHRDVKPANVLLSDEGSDAGIAETKVLTSLSPSRSRHGTPKITDFGLAKSLDGPTGHTATGAVLGTPSYMAPEQAAGKIKEIGPPADIYSLGSTFYELLTGRPPFRAATPLDTLLQSLANEPVPVRLLNPDVDRDLETICLKCLEKDPTHRYPSAEALAQDLDRYVAGDPISVRSVNVLERLARTLQRSQIDAGFEAWAAVLFWFAGLVLVTQIALFFIISYRLHPGIVRGTQAVQFVLMLVVLWRYRSANLLALNPVVRDLWSTWIGYLVGCGLVSLVSHQLVEPEKLYEFYLYPYWCILSGFGFFSMGSSHWGCFYAFGAAFFAMAALMAFVPIAGPFGFGILWALCLVIIGLRLRASGPA